MANNHIADDRKKVRLIDANAIIEKFEEHRNLFVDAWQGFAYLAPSDKARVDELGMCIAEIINAPTVDAVEVVRCGKCKKRPKDVEWGMCHVLCRQTHKDDFCSYGERRTENG